MQAVLILQITTPNFWVMFIGGAIQISTVILNFMFLIMAGDVIFENMKRMSHRTMQSGCYGSTEPLELPESNPVLCTECKNCC